MVRRYGRKPEVAETVEMVDDSRASSVAALEERVAELEAKLKAEDELVWQVTVDREVAETTWKRRKSGDYVFSTQPVFLSWLPPDVAADRHLVRRQVPRRVMTAARAQLIEPLLP
jgi:hypothetical protein